MSAIYIWVPSSTACARCENLGGIHHRKPQKPHDDCVCTRIKVDTNNQEKANCSGEPRILRMEMINYHHDVVNGQHVGLYHEYLVTGICPDNTIVTIELTYEAKGEEVQKIHDNFKAGREAGRTLEENAQIEHGKIQAEIRAEALDILKEECPKCNDSNSQNDPRPNS